MKTTRIEAGEILVIGMLIIAIVLVVTAISN